MSRFSERNRRKCYETGMTQFILTKCPHLDFFKTSLVSRNKPGNQEKLRVWVWLSLAQRGDGVLLTCFMQEHVMSAIKHVMVLLLWTDAG